MLVCQPDESLRGVQIVRQPPWPCPFFLPPSVAVVDAPCPRPPADRRTKKLKRDRAWLEKKKKLRKLGKTSGELFGGARYGTG